MHEELLDALAASGLREAGGALQLLRDGGQLDVHDGASCDGLLATYEVRLRHVRSMPSEHAHRLAEATSEFVSNLQRYRPGTGQWLEVQGNQEAHYLIFRLEDGRVLACLPAVSRLAVSPERWAELWGSDA
jgi:hypothetical protein